MPRVHGNWWERAVQHNRGFARHRCVEETVGCLLFSEWNVVALFSYVSGEAGKQTDDNLTTETTGRWWGKDDEDFERLENRVSLESGQRRSKWGDRWALSRLREIEQNRRTNLKISSRLCNARRSRGDESFAAEYTTSALGYQRYWAFVFAWIRFNNCPSTESARTVSYLTDRLDIKTGFDSVSRLATQFLAEIVDAIGIRVFRLAQLRTHISESLTFILSLNQKLMLLHYEN